MAKSARPKPPADLGDEGKALWAEVMKGLPTGWELDEREREILRLACRQADVNAALEAQIEKDGLMATGSKGQEVLHPAVQEARQGRLAIDRHLGHIALPAPEKAAGESSDTASERATKAANARWATDARRAARHG